MFDGSRIGSSPPIPNNRAEATGGYETQSTGSHLTGAHLELNTGPGKFSRTL